MIGTQTQSLRYFLDKIIDYAGLFPPASLDLKSALYNYLDYKVNSPYMWMLAKFICPASKLEDLDDLIQNEKITFSHQISFSVLGSSSVHTSEFLDSISRDVILISDFKNRYSGDVNIEAFEVRLPNDIFSIGGDNVLLDMIKLASEKLGKINRKSMPIFLEAMPNENLPLIAETVSKFNNSGGKAGYKLRTGGVEASAFPLPEKIAYAIMTCKDFEVPMKCTAGLHHPIRHYNESVKANMYGFINVFGAGILHCCHNLDSKVIMEILSDEDHNNFKFTDSSFSWKNLIVLVSKVEEVRKHFMLSFGSCSFEEPVDDLKKLGLL